MMQAWVVPIVVCFIVAGVAFFVGRSYGFEMGPGWVFYQRLNDLCVRHGAPTGAEKLSWLDLQLNELSARRGAPNPAESSSGEVQKEDPDGE